MFNYVVDYFNELRNYFKYNGNFDDGEDYFEEDYFEEDYFEKDYFEEDYFEEDYFEEDYFEEDYFEEVEAVDKKKRAIDDKNLFILNYYES
ncbi:7986_t:CDS:2 [Dentiscutata heterogama]|uniref:7986_t:CDS:1 n=1 Tax=Dentiscutata heterogama TaxID=1316150 RepID=A0ACA9K658_9GLOM|nr:7986_t:CDS:2 [Dentiscutata heterogama]